MKHLKQVAAKIAKLGRSTDVSRLVYDMLLLLVVVVAVRKTCSNPEK